MLKDTQDLRIVITTGFILIYLYTQHCDSFFQLKYYNYKTHDYGIGIYDFGIVITSLLVQLFLRSIVLTMCPFVTKKAINIINDNVSSTKTHLKHLSSHKSKRFSEQMWLFVYYFFIISYGTVIYFKSEYYNDVSKSFASDNYPQNYPHGFIKLYYLIQISCWFQQLITLHLEAKRKDYIEMFSHHLITIFLTIGSYYTSLWGMGHLIMLVMDIVDIFLVISKMLNYLHFTKLCNAMFGLFIMNWIFFRHIIFNYLTYITWKYIPLNCTVCSIDKTNNCVTPLLYRSFVIALLLLQVLQIIWFTMIFKLVVKIFKSSTSSSSSSSSSPNGDNRSDISDSRSDDECENEKE